ncbi:MAG: hypothetical protein SGPRY_011679, partial [Prymnesium sp.]
PADFRLCLRGKRLVMLGDCMMRYQYLSLVHYLQTGGWGVDTVDPQRLESQGGADLPRSIAIGFSLARHKHSGKTDYARFYKASNQMLGGRETCDCGMGDGRKGVFGRHENSVADFVRAKVAPLSPSLLVMNIGFWWFKRDYERMGLNASWWDQVLQASEVALKSSGGTMLLRTTTVPALWRRKDNDGVDQELIRSNKVDRVVLSLVRNRSQAGIGGGGGAKRVSFGVLDTYAMTRYFPTDHCNVRDSRANLIKFYSDDMHAQPFVYKEMNTVLFNMVCSRSHQEL